MWPGTRLVQFLQCFGGRKLLTLKKKIDKTLCTHTNYGGFCLLTPQAPHAQARQGNSDRPPVGRCEGCDWYALGLPTKLEAETIIAGPDEPGDRLTISGTIFKKDGRTPAEGVILYLYHTDAAAKYSPGKHQTQAKEHGRLRGWVKTGAEWKYVFHTILPAS